MAHSPLLNRSGAIGKDPGLGLGRNREKTEEQMVPQRWVSGLRIPGRGPAKAADTVYGARAKLKSKRELTPQTGRWKLR